MGDGRRVIRITIGFQEKWVDGLEGLFFVGCSCVVRNFEAVLWLRRGNDSILIRPRGHVTYLGGVEDFLDIPQRRIVFALRL
jgi:hypothetical protein